VSVRDGATRVSWVARTVVESSNARNVLAAAAPTAGARDATFAVARPGADHAGHAPVTPSPDDDTAVGLREGVCALTGRGRGGAPTRGAPARGAPWPSVDTDASRCSGAVDSGGKATGAA